MDRNEDIKRVFDHKSGKKFKYRAVLGGEYIEYVVKTRINVEVMDDLVQEFDTNVVSADTIKKFAAMGSTVLDL